MPRLIPLLLALLLLCLGCGSGKRANVTGDYLHRLKPARWDKPIVLYRVHGGPAIGASQIRAIVRTGIHRWDHTFSGILTLREAQGQQVEDIAIRFAPVGSLGGDFFGNQTLGRTTPVISAGRFVSVVVRLDSQLWARPVTLERIAAHEMGHALLNEGHSPHDSDLMHSPPSTSVPNQRDTNTARLVYALP